MTKLSGIGVFWAGALALFPPAGNPGGLVILRSEFLFSPAHPPTPSCHASTIVELDGGALAAAWFGGSGEGRGDVGIWLTSFRNGIWSEPREIAAGKGLPCWNPVLFRPRAGPLLLFYKVGPGPASWRAMLTTSLDGGRTWSEPARLPGGILGPIKNKPIELPDGTLLCGSSSEDDGWKVHFERTSDLGRTWSRTEAVNDGRSIGAIQPALLVHPGGTIQALGRSRQGRVWECWSTDAGRTWGPLTLGPLPNPNSGIDAATLRDGRQILVYNPTETGRSPLSVAVSDDGRTWKNVLELESGPGEYSYPAVIQASDGRIHVTYTWKRESIKHVVLDPEACR